MIIPSDNFNEGASHEVTPEGYVCNSCAACPAVFETENNSYVIIGKKLSTAAESAVVGRVGANEFVVEVPKGMIDGLK